MHIIVCFCVCVCVFFFFFLWGGGGGGGEIKFTCLPSSAEDVEIPEVCFQSHSATAES